MIPPLGRWQHHYVHAARFRCRLEAADWNLSQAVLRWCDGRTAPSLLPVYRLRRTPSPGAHASEAPPGALGEGAPLLELCLNRIHTLSSPDSVYPSPRCVHPSPRCSFLAAPLWCAARPWWCRRTTRALIAWSQRPSVKATGLERGCAIADMPRAPTPSGGRTQQAKRRNAWCPIRTSLCSAVTGRSLANDATRGVGIPTL